MRRPANASNVPILAARYRANAHRLAHVLKLSTVAALPRFRWLSPVCGWRADEPLSSGRLRARACRPPAGELDMKWVDRKPLRHLAVGLVFATLGAMAQAQQPYPSHTITLVAPFAAGSGTDIATRILAKDMSALMGGAVVIVENKPGANGAIGSQAVARAKPDGYTLLVGSATTNAANFAFFPGKLGYEPASFEIITPMGLTHVGLYVAAGSPWKDVNDLVADAKRNPGKFSCGSGNAVMHVACEVFRKRNGIEAVNVPYKSNALGVGDVVGGQLAYAFSDAAAAASFVEGKRARALAMASAQRNPALPEVATFKEQGMADFELTAWAAVFAPAGTPPAVLEKLNAVVRKALESPEMAASRKRAGSVMQSLDLAEAKAFAAEQVARWARYVKDSGVKPE
jgi:tripartite-type tricarboxylate transporter receptor subunit TctC